MRYISLILLFTFQLLTNSLSAATLELDMGYILPQQNLIKTLRIEAEGLKAEMALNNGQVLDPLVTKQWPPFSDIALIFVQGPEVQFKVITYNGSEWTRSLGSFDLKITHLINGNRREIALDLHATPLDKMFEQKDANTTANFGYYLFKTLLLVAKGNLHFYVLTSMDMENNAHPAMKMKFEQNRQSLALELENQQDGLKVGTWKIHGNGFGKGALTNLVLSALNTMSEAYRNMEEKTEYDQLLQQIFYGIDLFLDFTAPVSKWTGINITIQGSFDYLNKNDTFFTHISNHFQLDTYDGSWSSSLGSKSYFSIGIADSPAWNQEFILKNPAHDLKKAAEWIQLNWTNQLADLINMPSIKYYADYFPKYFIQGLTLIFSSLGEIQEDGTISFKFSSNADGSFTICGLNPSEIAALIVTKIKEKMGGWYN